ncbi:hypothetical protein [Methylopila sp. M107]|uniref:hypothetical protein n=1 Tax=Methylopila sp. M107 TaxID=1101190 RepID=UPI00037A2AAE|nr:hypothetical protein [Methylopila sp. M107]
MIAARAAAAFLGSAVFVAALMTGPALVGLAWARVGTWPEAALIPILGLALAAAVVVAHRPSDRLARAAAVVALGTLVALGIAL